MIYGSEHFFSQFENLNARERRYFFHLLYQQQNNFNLLNSIVKSLFDERLESYGSWYPTNQEYEVVFPIFNYFINNFIYIKRKNIINDLLNEDE